MREKRFLCRHCLLLRSGTCPFPVAKSPHRMSIPAGKCKLATLDPQFAYIYPDLAKSSGIIQVNSDTGRKKEGNHAV